VRYGVTRETFLDTVRDHIRERKLGLTVFDA